MCLSRIFSNQEIGRAQNPLIIDLYPLDRATFGLEAHIEMTFGTHHRRLVSDVSG
jgi:hypothetical protein